MVCWLSTRNDRLAAKDAAAELGALASVISVETLREVPSSTEVLVCGEVAYFEDSEALKCLGRQRLRCVVVPYAGVHSKIRSVVVEANALRGERLVLANCHHNAAMTAEMAVALALAAGKRLVQGDRELRADDWRGRGMVLKGSPVPPPAISQSILDGDLALVVGLGAVGKRVALALAALGCNIAATTASSKHVSQRRVAVGVAEASITLYPTDRLGELLPQAGLVVLCVPLNPATRGLIGAAELEAMRPDAVLVNVGRGAVVEEAALVDALRQKKLAHYASDVWWHYPSDWDDAGHCAPCRDGAGARVALPEDRTLLSPHRGGAVGHPENSKRLAAAITAGLRSLVQTKAYDRLGPPLGVVDLDVGY